VIPGLLDVTPTLTLLWTIMAGVTIIQLVRSWRVLHQSCLTLELVTLAAAIGILVLAPVGVVVHELGHAAVARAFGARDIAINLSFIHGSVSYRGFLRPEQRWLIAAAGPAVNAGVGLLALAISTRLPLSMGAIARYFGLWALLSMLVFYPIGSFVERSGDFTVIFAGNTPRLATIAAVSWLACASAGILLYRWSGRRFNHVEQEAVMGSAQMEPTIPRGARFHVRRPVRSIHRGDIVVVRRGEETAVQRVVGIPGDILEIAGGQLLLDGEPAAEPYATEPMAFVVPALRIEDDYYFVLGDNRNYSIDDSQPVQPIRRKAIVAVKSACA
jgi:signal peptidase I